MEIRNLNTFLKVAAVQNFTQASRELGYSQSNVSAQIKQLEEEVGAALFDRIGRSVCLTQQGEELIPYARQIVSTAARMESFLKSEEFMSGTLRVGMTQSLFEIVLEDVFLRYHRRFPLVRMELTVDATSALKTDLQHGRLDTACLIDNPLPQTEWLSWYCVEVPVVLVANPAHPLAGRETVEMEDLAGQDFILMEESAPYAVRFQDALAGRQIQCRPFLKLQSAATARNLVERERFLSVLPLYTVQDAVRAGRLSILRVPQWNQTQSVQLALHRNKVMTPQIHGFLQELRQILEEALRDCLAAP